jgi:hypothetical protein
VILTLLKYREAHRRMSVSHIEIRLSCFGLVLFQY